MSTLALNRSFELQMPSSFVDIDREEMEYLEGGIKISNQIIAGAIDTAIWMIPGMKQFKGTTLGFAMLSSTAKNQVVRTICNVLTNVSLGWLKMSESKIMAVLLNFTGFSIGSYIAENVVDPMDGARDGGLRIG